MSDSRKSRKVFLESKEKEVIKLLKRQNKLLEISRNLGYADLVPPIRKGWKRTFVFRPHVKLFKDYKILLQILDMIQNPVVCDNKQFVIPKRKRHKEKPIIQNTHSLSDEKYFKLDTVMQKHFTPVWRRYRYWNTLYRTWEFNRQNLLDFQIKPNFITKVKLYDQDIEKELAEIHDKLWGKGQLYQKYAKDKPSNRGSWYEATRYDRIYEKVIDKEIKEYS